MEELATERGPPVAAIPAPRTLTLHTLTKGHHADFPRSR
jgi:hypothetical protein